MRERKKRCLSNHVISRWYRPPEVILVEKNYGLPADMWGSGCILAEMITCTYKSKDITKRFLFGGTSCFPLSPCDEMKKAKN